MGTESNGILKNITNIKKIVYVEKNRELKLSDYSAIKESVVEVRDSVSNDGKIITIKSSYILDESIMVELIDYQLKSNDNGINSVKGVYGEFSIVKSVNIDFRGCKTEEQKQGKVDKSIETLKEEYSDKLDLLLDTKIKLLNQTLDTQIAYCNDEYTKRIINTVVQPSIFNDDFNKNEEFQNMTINYAETLAKIATLDTIKLALEENITAKKREIAIKSLEKDNWQLTFKDEKHKHQLPKPIIDKIKKEISVAFNF